MAAKKTPAKKAPAKRGPKTVTDEHKAAMAKGRRAASAVGAYVEALDQNKPRRRRELSAEQLDAHLADAHEAVKNETGVRKLAAAQHVVDLERRIVESTAPQVDISALEDAFVEWAPIYAASKGISYAAFRAVGVPAAALKRAGISRAQ